MVEISEIQFEEISGREGHLGLITLTRPQVLNALNQTMVYALYEQLREWEGANHIKAVVIRAAEGRAFCAGGDIRLLYEHRLKKDPNVYSFFRDEYRLNRYIHNYSKPYIALLDGITMGGGAGISIHGSHRVATERLVFAMPETGIGFYPDVGMNYFLARLTDNVGRYLALTGARIDLGDCIALGLVDYAVLPDCYPDIIYQLADTAFEETPEKTVSHILQSFNKPADGSSLLQYRNEIKHCFVLETVETILQALEENNSAWCQSTVEILKSKCPISLKVTLRALQRAAQLDFNDCIQMDYALTTRFLAGYNFMEGIRAAVIDKDKQPHWQPATLQEVSNAEVEKYFLAFEQIL